MDYHLFYPMFGTEPWNWEFVLLQRVWMKTPEILHCTNLAATLTRQILCQAPLKSLFLRAPSYHNNLPLALKSLLNLTFESFAFKPRSPIQLKSNRHVNKKIISIGMIHINAGLSNHQLVVMFTSILQP